MAIQHRADRVEAGNRIHPRVRLLWLRLLRGATETRGAWFDGRGSVNRVRGTRRRRLLIPSFVVVVLLSACVLSSGGAASAAQLRKPPPTSIGTIAAVEAAPSSGSAPLLVNFNGAQSNANGGTIASWDLSFGDGSPDATGTGAPGAVIDHTYLTVGTFTATLTLTDASLGAVTANATITVSGPLATGGANGAIVVPVTGATLTSLTSSSLPLVPAFDPATTDYVWYCASSGSNQITLTLAGNGSISAGGVTGTTVSLPISMVPNQATVVQAPSGTDYWIRCLPPTFPHLQVTTTGTAQSGYYLTGTFKSTPRGLPGYAMILNSAGTPVWYLTGLPNSGDNVELLPGTHTVAWSNHGPYSLYNMDTQTVSWLAPPVNPPDEHELFMDASGNSWMISVPVLSGYNLSGIGYPTQHNIVDCVVQELSPTGQLLWSWDASQHVSPLETNKLSYVMTDQGVPAVDVYHCNSLDVNPMHPNEVLVSMREAGVFLIDKTTGSIDWKFGGTSAIPMGGEKVLALTGDPEGAIQGQHDARFQPNGDVSLFDDHTGLAGAARGVEYSIDAAAGTAAMVWQYAAPSGLHTSRMGSVRRYDITGQSYDQSGSSYQGASETMVDWGQGIPSAGFSVVDSTGTQLMNVVFPKAYVGNRGEFVPLSALDLAELRNTAGSAFP